MDTLWEIEDSVHTKLVDGGSKSEWYDVLGELPLDLARLNAEESIAAWDYLLRNQPYPASVLFAGEKHTAQDGFDDPNVSFIGQQLVKDIAIWLAQSYELIAAVANGTSLGNELWLYEPLTEFFSSVSKRGNAIIILWEGPTKW